MTLTSQEIRHFEIPEVRQTLDALKVMCLGMEWAMNTIWFPVVPCGSLWPRHASGRIHKDLKAENVMVDLPAAESPTFAKKNVAFFRVNQR